MAAQNGLDFEGDFNNAIDGLFKNNTTRDISPTDQRVLVTAIKESYLNRLDDFVDEDEMTSNSSTKAPSQQSVKSYVDGLVITREFNRVFAEELLFDKNEIFYAPYELDDDLTFTIAATGNLSNRAAGARQRIITDGTHSISFGPGFDFIYGISNGQILDAGNYEIYYLYTNGSVTVNVPGVSQQSSELVQLLTPADFAVVADGENALDFTWTDVANEASYQIEHSTDGSSWTLYSTPAAGTTSGTETGLTAGTTMYYRIKAVGDGSIYTDSPYTQAQGTTIIIGDVTAPTFTWLPVNGNNTWPVNKPITITANEGLQNDDGTPLTSANVATRITLKQTNSGGANISFTATIDASKTIITITPATLYGGTQLVYVAIDNVEDAAGNEISVTSITFTTTNYTLFDGVDDRLTFGDILDTLFCVDNTNFWLEATLKDPILTGPRILFAKIQSGDVQTNCFSFYYLQDSFFFTYYMSTLGNGRLRTIVWEATDIAAGVNTIVLKYDGAIDTNDGLDRCTLLINGVTQTGAYSNLPSGTLTGILTNSTAHLAFGNSINGLGTPVQTRWYEGEVKDLIIRSAAGATISMNVPIVRSGTDTSGNGFNGTWGG